MLLRPILCVVQASLKEEPGRIVASLVPSTVIDMSDEDDDCEEGSSKNPKLLTPKIEGSGSKRKATVEAERKVKEVLREELGEEALTPSATLPFSPETDVVYKPYENIQSPYSKNPSRTGVTALKSRKILLP